MGGSSKKVTVGYKYYLGIHFALVHGPVDSLRAIRVDNRLLWQGESTGGSITVSKEDLFGGSSREGGVSGTLDFCSGGPTQTQNSYLLSQLGSLIPAFRGVAAVVLRQMYIGMNPYLKRWAFRVQRIHTRQNGLEQWYDEKAAIPVTGFGEEPAQVVDLDSIDNAANDATGGLVAGVTITVDDPRRAIIIKPVTDGSETYISHSPWGVPALGGAFTGTVYRFNVIKDGDISTETTQTVGGPYDGYEAARAAFIAQYPSGLTLSGATSYTFYIQDSVIPDNTGGLSFTVEVAASFDMNPAHIIRECLTDPDWGMGYNEADIDDTAFQAAADQLFDEGLGISLLWDRQSQIDDFIQEVMKHIDAALYVDRETGKFVLKLIRDDYEEGDLLSLGEDEIDRVDNFTQPQFGELTTSVTANFWDASTNTPGSVQVQDIALEQMQQASINTTLAYPGVSSKAVATRLAQRALRTLSSQLRSCTVYADRTAKDLKPGDVFKLTWPDYEMEEVVMRVTGIAYGDGRSNRVRITCAEDVFRLDELALIPPAAPSWEDPGAPPTSATLRLAFEVPYLELVQIEGQATVDDNLDLNPDSGRLGLAAGRPGAAVQGRIAIDQGSGYEESVLMEFCPTAELVGDLDRISTTFTIASAQEIDSVTVGSWCEMGGELMAVVSVTETSLEVERGCLDTVPVTHTDGEKIFFWDALSGMDETDFVSGEEIDVKLLTITGGGVLPLASAPVDTLEFGARAIRPYPPGNLQVNGEYFPPLVEGDVVLTWAHRDRLQQTGAELVGFPEASIGPEAGTTYTIRVYDDADNLVHTESGVSGTTYTYDAAQEASDGGPFPSLRLEVESVRGGYTSYQKHDFVITRPAPVEPEGVFIPDPNTSNRPIALLWNDDYFVVSISGTMEDVGAIGLYKLADDLAGSPEFLGATYDARSGGSHIPDSYNHLLSRAHEAYRPLAAGGADQEFFAYWRRVSGGLANPDQRWMMVANPATPSFEMLDTEITLNVDLVAVVKLASGDLRALATTGAGPLKTYGSATGGRTWSLLGNTTGLPESGSSTYQSAYKLFELGDGSLYMPGYKSDDGLAWTEFEVFESAGDYELVTVRDMAYNGSYLVANCRSIPSMTYADEVAADSPVCWLRFGDGVGEDALLLDSVSGNTMTRFSPGVGITGAGISQVDGLVAQANAALVESYGVRCTVATYMEPRTSGNGPVNFISGTSDFTVEMWTSAKDGLPDTPSGTLTLFSQSKLLTTSGTVSSILLTYVVSTNTYTLQIRDNQANQATTGTLVTNISGVGPDLFGDPDEIHHVVIRRGASGRAAIIVDNSAVASQGSGTVADVTSGSLAAGTIWGNTFGAGSTYYSSRLDECAIYLTELSDARVEAHYEAGLLDSKYYNTLFRSTDGETWTRERHVLAESDIPSGHSFDLEWVQVVQFDTGFLVYGKENAPSTERFPYVLVSTDDGDTWASPARVITPDYVDDATGNGILVHVVVDDGLGKLLASITSLPVGPSLYEQLCESDDGVNFTALSLSFPTGAAGVTLRVSESDEGRLTEGGDARVSE